MVEVNRVFLATFLCYNMETGKQLTLQMHNNILSHQYH